jgi:serine/threonine protein kinase
MSLTGTLLAFGLRQAFDVDSDRFTQLIENHFTDHSQALPAALARANDRAWQALGLALGGDGFFDRLKSLWIDGDVKAVRDQVRLFLEQTPTGLEGTPAEVRARCVEDLRRLRKAGRLKAELTGRELAGRTAGMQRFSDPARLAAAAHQAVAVVADALVVEAPDLASLVRRPSSHDGPPLLVAAFAFFFRREIEQNAELARGLTFDNLRLLAAAQERGFAALEQGIGRQLDRITDLLDRIEAGQGAVLAELEHIRSELAQLLERNRVPAGPTSSPLGVSVTDEREHQRLRALRDRLRSLPPDAAGADDWLRLGDGLRAAAMFDLARESHERAATTASAADPARAAEASYKTYGDACEVGAWDSALAALRTAWKLQPERYELFDRHRYEPLAILGAGGFGTVFRCRDQYVHEEVAVKTLHDGDLARSLDEVFKEAQALKLLRHPNIIGLVSCDFADRRARKRPYLVLELFAGVSLETWLRLHGLLPVEDLLAVARAVADALQAAHSANVLHRDLKPGNILVRQEASVWKVRVIDFGLAVRQTAVHASIVLPSGQRSMRDHSFAGTLRYAAPEQKGELRTPVPVGPYSDVYGFGKTCFEALFGTTEPISEDWEQLPSAWQQSLRRVLEKCVVTQPERRFQDFRQVLAALDALTPQPRAKPEPLPEKVEGPSASQEPVERKPGSVLAVRIPVPEPEHRPGELLTLLVRVLDPERRPGEITTLKWKPVASRPAPRR